MVRRGARIVLLGVAMTLSAVVGTALGHTGKPRYCGTWEATRSVSMRQRTSVAGRPRRSTRDSFKHSCPAKGSCRADRYDCRPRKQHSGDYRTTCTPGDRKVVWIGG